MTILATPKDWTLTFLRVSLGLIMLPHGAQKLLGMFGGSGYAATLSFFESALGIPPWLTTLVILTEFFGSLLLIVGLLGRLAALALTANMVGAMLTVNLANGFFWTQGGVEFPLLIALVACVILVRGSGALSLDRALSTGRAPARRSYSL
jgi:putative oxidoreductase